MVMVCVRFFVLLFFSSSSFPCFFFSMSGLFFIIYLLTWFVGLAWIALDCIIFGGDFNARFFPSLVSRCICVFLSLFFFVLVLRVLLYFAYNRIR